MNLRIVLVQVGTLNLMWGAVLLARWILLPEDRSPPLIGLIAAAQLLTTATMAAALAARLIL